MRERRDACRRNNNAATTTIIIEKKKLRMEILNSLKSAVVTLLLLLSVISVSGSVNHQREVDSVRITYGHLDGYAIYQSRAIYAFHNNAYVLQKEEALGANSAQQLPDTIMRETVCKLLNDSRLYAKEDYCDCVRITTEDYADYMRVLNDSIHDPLPFIKDLPKDQYELDKNVFLLLSCSDIIKIVESPDQKIYIPKPLLKIELTGSDGCIMSMEPKSYYEGTAWEITCDGKKSYLDFEHVMSFLKETHFDKYAYFFERFYLLFQIADKLKGREGRQ